jgi:hypothetical protein
MSRDLMQTRKEYIFLLLRKGELKYMKYKVGDKVRVRKDLFVDSCYGREDFV